MNKLILGLVLVSLIGVGCAYTLEYSSPTREDGSTITWTTSTPPIKQDCPRTEWNDHFEKYRAGDISKEDMKIYIRSCA